ncbi:MAG: DNA methylase, partial [Thermoplasmata archaeon]
IKNFDYTRGKRSQQELWRYRALQGEYYVFKHEYIFIFKKT